MGSAARKGGAARLHHVARVPADLPVRDGVLECLAEDRVQAARVGGRQRGVEGPEVTRVPRQVLREEAADPPDVAADPALVVAPGPRGQVAAVTPVPVVYELPHGEAPAGPRLRLTLVVEALQEGSCLFLRWEAAPVTAPADDPSNAKRPSMLLDVATSGASHVDLLLRPFRGEDRSGSRERGYELPLTQRPGWGSMGADGVAPNRPQSREHRPIDCQVDRVRAVAQLG
jgi:hypothetical protein